MDLFPQRQIVGSDEILFDYACITFHEISKYLEIITYRIKSFSHSSNREIKLLVVNSQSQLIARSTLPDTVADVVGVVRKDSTS